MARQWFGLVALALLGSAACALNRAGSNSSGGGSGGTDVMATNSSSSSSSMNTGGGGSGAASSSTTASTGGSGGIGDVGGAGGVGDVGGAGGEAPLYPCTAANEYKGGPDDHCYFVVLPNNNWTGARTTCQNWGGELAAISSQLELDFITTFIATGDQDHWLGGYDSDPPNAAWAWTNGEVWGLSGWGATDGVFPWKSNQPDMVMDEPYVKIKDGEFENKEDSHMQSAICERP